MTWENVCSDPPLDALPWRIGLDQHGRVVMSPVSERHGRVQGRIALVEDGLGGEAHPEGAIQTARGIRSPDVVWRSDAFASSIPAGAPALGSAPEICVEVRPSSSPWAEVEETITRHLAKAQEVRICEPDAPAAVQP